MIPRDLTHPMCAVLVEHVDGRVPIDRSNKVRMCSVRTLVERGLLKTWTDNGERRGPHPRFTYLTEAGRAALAGVLAHYADALVRAKVVREDALSIPGRVRPRLAAE